MGQKNLEIDPEHTVIVAHADHDGIAAAAGIIETFGKITTIFSQRAINAKVNIPETVNTIILADVMGKRDWIESLLQRGKTVINMDHHDPLRIKHPNYITYNPKLRNELFVSSSTLVWRLLRPERIAWALAAGAVADICAEGSMDLIRKVVNVNTWKEVYYTPLHDVGWAMLYGNPHQRLREILTMSFERFSKRYVSEMQELKKRMLKDIENKIEEHSRYVVIDARGLPYQGSYSVVLNLKNGDERFYIEIGDRRTFIRNFFGNYDVAALAKRLGGGGSHPRTGSAPIKDITKIRAAITQTSLF